MDNFAKKVLISGSTGQDGSYMAEYLLENTDNTLILAARRTSQAILGNIQHILNNPRVKLITLDLMDNQAIRETIKNELPDYFINLGAQTFVADAWKHPTQHMQINALSLISILEAVREYVPSCRVYSAGSSEQFGNGDNPYSPRSMYGVSKCTAGMICKVYRESYGLYVVHGILFNHESERRQDYFVTRKITKGVARIARVIRGAAWTGETEFAPIELGNLNAKRDWSHAKDFVDGIWRMLNQDIYRTDWHGNGNEYIFFLNIREIANRYEGVEYLKDYILASGETHSIREFVELAFQEVGVTGMWGCDSADIGKPTGEYFSTGSGNLFKKLVIINPKFYRPADVEVLCGNARKARQELGWEPQISFNQLVSGMVKADLNH